MPPFETDEKSKPGLDSHRHIGFFPALPLGKNIEFGEWIVGTPPPGEVWASDSFRTLSYKLMDSFACSGFKGGAMLWHRTRGFDGELPEEEDIAAIQASIRFASLDSNDAIADDENKAYFLVTSENAELFLQPIDEIKGRIAYRNDGFLKKNIVAGYKIGEQHPPLPSATMSLMQPVLISHRLTRAAYDHLTTARGQPSHIRLAMEWHASALTNPTAVTHQQRLIALKNRF